MHSDYTDEDDEQLSELSVEVPDADVLFQVQARQNFQPTEEMELPLVDGIRYNVTAEEGGWYLGRPVGASRGAPSKHITAPVFPCMPASR